MPLTPIPPAVSPGHSSRSIATAHLKCGRVAAIVAQDFAVDCATLFERTRSSPRAALARQTAMYLAHTVFALSFGQIGRIYGRDRTTVAHACRRIEEARDADGFDERLRRLETRCRRPKSAGDHDLRVSLKVVR